jgi:hypothetical protein
MSFLLRSLAAAVLSLCLVAGSARASQVVFGNLGATGAGAIGGTRTPITSTDWLAQGFTTGASSTFLFVDNIVLGLTSTGGGAVNATISIWSSSASQPSALLYNSSSQSISAQDKYTFGFGGAALAANTSYWVVVQQNGIDWNVRSTFATPAGQNASGYSYLGTSLTENSGSLWEASELQAYAISITASDSGPAPEPIPEPGTWAAAALLICAAAYVRFRRRPQAA